MGGHKPGEGVEASIKYLHSFGSQFQQQHMPTRKKFTSFKIFDNEVSKEQKRDIYLVLEKLLNTQLIKLNDKTKQIRNILDVDSCYKILQKVLTCNHWNSHYIGHV